MEKGTVDKKDTPQNIDKRKYADIKCRVMVHQKGSLPQADATPDRLSLKCSVSDTDGEELKNSPFLFPSVQRIVVFQGQPIKGKAEPSGSAGWVFPLRLRI